MPLIKKTNGKPVFSIFDSIKLTAYLRDKEGHCRKINHRMFKGEQIFWGDSITSAIGLQFRSKVIDQYDMSIRIRANAFIKEYMF